MQGSSNLCWRHEEREGGRRKSTLQVRCLLKMMIIVMPIVIILTCYCTKTMLKYGKTRDLPPPMLLKIPKQYRVFVRDPYSGQGRCAPTCKRVLRWIGTRIHFKFHRFLCLWYLISLTIDISHISSLWYLMCFTFDLFNIWCLSYFISDSNTIVHKLFVKYWKMSRLKSKMKYDFRSAATNCARIIATQRSRCKSKACAF